MQTANDLVLAPARAKVTLVQKLPCDPEPMFQIVEEVKGDHYWHVKIKDAIYGDEPEFIYRLPKKSKKEPATEYDVALAGAKELNEYRGLVCVRRYHNGLPCSLEWYAANGSHVFRVRDYDYAKGRQAIAEYQAKRKAAR